MITQPTRSAINLDPDSFDFLELVSFVWKAQWEGDFSYTWDNYPPIFRLPELHDCETDRSKFRRLLDRHRAKIIEWENAVDPTEGTRIMNAHCQEAGAERDRRCLWAVRFANGNISCERNKDIARRIGSNESWGYPAVLYRKTPDHDWQEVAPLGPKSPT